VGIKDDESVDCHPLIREYFAVQLKRQSKSWQAGQKRLYEYLCESTHEGDQPTLEDLQPLYQAVAHGCQAGLQRDACYNVYFARIKRREESYSTRKLGAFGSDLGAVAWFFETLWSRLSSTLREANHAWLLNEAAFRLRALGRLTEALDPMRAGLDMGIRHKNWKTCAPRASNLSELELTLGQVATAVGHAEQSVTYADRSDDKFWKMASRTTHADALHYAGRRDEAERRFREAEQLQTENQPEYPLLYSQQGFIYCDLLLAAPERVAWVGIENTERTVKKQELLAACRVVIQRATQTLQWAEQNRVDILSAAFDRLTLVRAALYAAILGHSEFQIPHSELDQVVSGLYRASQQQYLPLGLLTRAWCSFVEASEHSRHGREKDAMGCLNRAQADLDEAWDIAVRGPMPLFMADIHLYRARLFGKTTYPWESPAADLAAARELIEKHGYWRRKEELEDAEAALR